MFLVPHSLFHPRVHPFKESAFYDQFVTPYQRVVIQRRMMAPHTLPCIKHYNSCKYTTLNELLDKLITITSMSAKVIF